MKSSIPFKHVPETGSTNQDLLDSVGSDDPTPAAILTDSQTVGRGRLGRVWENDQVVDGPVQAMLGSVRQDWPTGDPAMPLVPFATGLAVLAACNRWTNGGKFLGLKWPNDVIVGATNDTTSEFTFRKVAGILVEAVSVPKSDRSAVIIGVGMNLWPVTASGQDLGRNVPASLSELCSEMPTNVQIFQEFLRQLQLKTAALRADRIALLDEYREACWTIGRAVRFEGMDGPSRAEGVADDGTLTVRTKDGSTVSIGAGDVQVIG